MTCPHIAHFALCPVTPSTVIFKDECTQCFSTWDNPNGIDICLSCFNSGCADHHSTLHFQHTDHALAVNLRRISKLRDSSPPPKITKLAIQADTDQDKYEIISAVKCLQCKINAIHDIPPHITETVNSIKQSSSTSSLHQIQAWELELEACEHTVCLDQTHTFNLDASTAHCGECELTENLWLCLVCGHLGCGRHQVGGTAGNGHALQHTLECSPKHSVAVKLGTITPDGTADVYCYSCDDERLDPYLNQHLANFNINLSLAVKTEKSLIEMQIEHNLNFEFEMTSTDGQLLVPYAQPWYRGLSNLGNSCYLNSVVQCLFHIPEFRVRYTGDHPPLNMGGKHYDCWESQWSKLGHALLQGGDVPSASSTPNETSRGPVRPIMFKRLLANNHKEFTSMKQQDASEYFQFVLERTSQYCLQNGTSVDPTHVFQFQQTQLIRCTECNGVRESTIDANVINMLIPDRALKAGLNPTDDESAADITVRAVECLQSAMSEAVEFDCSRCAKRVVGIKKTGLKTFPKYLVIVAQRFTYENWVPKKSNVRVSWPGAGDSNTTTPQNLSFLHVAVSATDEVLTDTATETPAPPQDPPEVNQLVDFGLSLQKARRSLRETGGNLELALNWAMDHPEINGDEDLAPAPSKETANESAIAMLQEMGFTRSQCLLGLHNTDNQVEYAIEWLFSHPDEVACADSILESMVTADPPAVETCSKIRSDVDTNTAPYAMDAFINHKGPSMHCGHYIAHLYEDPHWIMVNDDRVVINPTPTQLLQEAYVYILRRLDP